MFRSVHNAEGPPYEVGLGENQWPQTPKMFRDAPEEYISSVLSLGIEVVKAIAVALDVDEKVLVSRADQNF